MSKIINCPRCGEKSYEVLQTHNHCFNCLYSKTLTLSKARREQLDFMTLKEAESLLKKSEVSSLSHQIKNNNEEVIL